MEREREKAEGEKDHAGGGQERAGQRVRRDAAAATSKRGEKRVRSGGSPLLCTHARYHTHTRQPVGSLTLARAIASVANQLDCAADWPVSGVATIR